MNTIANQKALRRASAESLEQRAERLFVETDYTPPGTVAHNRAEWIKAVRLLGSRWVGSVHAKRDALCLIVAGAGAVPLMVADLLAKVA